VKNFDLGDGYTWPSFLLVKCKNLDESLLLAETIWKLGLEYKNAHTLIQFSIQMGVW